ncbi:DNA-processing protein DprA [Allonocardiopsis opalescens]|uniref:DNA-processing protein DprA n=1 Tax=Allonocardiopsis opalescens TaxID=1144618 RepID=UPI001FEA9E89|nr:DNA-processing protein DprA [Allonocardiopsis opalescens]
MAAGLDDPWARAVLTAVANPADELLGRLLDRCGAAPVVAWIAGTGAEPAASAELAAGAAEKLRTRLDRWRARYERLDQDAMRAAAEAIGARLVCPGDPEWPTQLDDLGAARPYALWTRGGGDLRFAALRSVAVVGARAATAYGAHVAAELCHGLGERGWTTVSGGAYGIDGAAHRGALAADRPTVVVLACGVDVPYPCGHSSLFQRIAADGVILSEWPPGTVPSRHAFLIRNRVIAALSRGTVVVEAKTRSGALNTARHARELGRAVMAVPGPVTGEMSAGCHLLLREWQAGCVTGAADVLDQVGLIGEDMAPPPDATVLPRDRLDPTSAAILDAVPARGAAGPATIAVTAGHDLDTTLRCLGLLAAGGFVERAPTGWRLPRRAAP